MPVASSHYQFQDSYFMVIHLFAYIVISVVVLVGCVCLMGWRKRRHYKRALIKSDLKNDFL
ncbi:hypothetical protein I6G82_07405 [Lysinibacillus macroides]|uniref:Uncharacterized protein n=1 Tax=Lysinibacillus macroides TaxID=33935 RepID=A0A0M9DLU9_9BACI|nr:hypothetical protein [Lysinibacillus macroides]KOY83539.1 hypothetical protein ADM90_09905 [Lysinibacillus macroides]QPR69417.1 hypothetical protein I6G82_07405 [Lysinibacillus macroides]